MPKLVDLADPLPRLQPVQEGPRSWVGPHRWVRRDDHVRLAKTTRQPTSPMMAARGEPRRPRCKSSRLSAASTPSSLRRNR